MRDSITMLAQCSYPIVSTQEYDGCVAQILHPFFLGKFDNLRWTNFLTFINRTLKLRTVDSAIVVGSQVLTNSTDIK